ncbi:MAG: hypothetical protein DMD99_17545 [Candidatus Rokuibacteriota bacterium]|nr:MAG: hypothetical protein DMD99_17545 [Candidatus Rokubacteria bacterium]
MTPERFAKGMTFEDYVKFTGSPENLGREGFDIRRFSLVRPRVDWTQRPSRTAADVVTIGSGSTA